MQMWGFCEWNDCGYKCFLQSHALWTWRGWQFPGAIYVPPPQICFHGCQGLAAASTLSLLRCHLLPSSLGLRSNFQLVINTKWGEASWMQVFGGSPSWAKSEFELAFFITTVSNSATFTDGMPQSALGPQRLLNGLSGGLESPRAGQKITPSP